MANSGAVQARPPVVPSAAASAPAAAASAPPAAASAPPAAASAPAAAASAPAAAASTAAAATPAAAVTPAAAATPEAAAAPAAQTPEQKAAAEREQQILQSIAGTKGSDMVKWLIENNPKVVQGPRRIASGPNAGGLIYPGDTLKTPFGEYTVVKGDNLYKIAAGISAEARRRAGGGAASGSDGFVAGNADKAAPKRDAAQATPEAAEKALASLKPELVAPRLEQQPALGEALGAQLTAIKNANPPLAQTANFAALTALVVKANKACDDKAQDIAKFIAAAKDKATPDAQLQPMAKAIAPFVRQADKIELAKVGIRIDAKPQNQPSPEQIAAMQAAEMAALNKLSTDASYPAELKPKLTALLTAIAAKDMPKAQSLSQELAADDRHNKAFDAAYVEPAAPAADKK